MNKIIEKMENHIRKLKQRNLSLHGKAILLSILIIAKMTYVSIIFQTLPKNVSENIPKDFSRPMVIWWGKAEPIARKTIFL